MEEIWNFIYRSKTSVQRERSKSNLAGKKGHHSCFACKQHVDRSLNIRADSMGLRYAWL